MLSAIIIRLICSCPQGKPRPQRVCFLCACTGNISAGSGICSQHMAFKTSPLFFTGLVLAMSLLLNRFPDIRMMVMTTVFVED